MSELRRDPITGHWVVIAEGRSLRPNEYAASPPPGSAEDCPFCEGQESRTPPEVAAVRPKGSRPGGPGWSVRAIPNKFPTLVPDSPPPAGSGPLPSHEARPGHGYHEVIIVSPRHLPALPFLPDEQVQSVVRMFRDRVRELESRPKISGVVLFENYGPESGGTLVHPHAQVVATPVVPPLVAEEADSMRRYSSAHSDRCLLESVAAEERRTKTRVLVDDGVFLAVAPFASGHPYEILLMPERHSASITEATDAELARLAQLLPALLRTQFAVVPSLSYNYFVHVAPVPKSSHPEFHWHIEIVPRLVRPDGFELGSGILVNPVSPEAAASALRAAYTAAATAGAR